MLVVLEFRRHNHEVTVNYCIAIKSTPLAEIFVKPVIVNYSVALILPLGKI